MCAALRVRRGVQCVEGAGERGGEGCWRGGRAHLSCVCASRKTGGRVCGGELLQLSPKQRVDMVGNNYKLTRQREEDLRFPFTRPYEPKSHLNSAKIDMS